MSRFQLELATLADDVQLRSVLARTPMDGRISISFRREPSFFGAAVVDGRFRQIIVGRDREAGGSVIGFGSRSVRDAYVNGRVAPVGYLSSLRLLPEYRRCGAIVGRGFRYFSELHRDGRTKLYVTTIAEGNKRAMAVLAARRAGMPAYHFAGDYFTAAIPLRRGRPMLIDRVSGNVTIRRARKEDLPLIQDFLWCHGARRQFFPVHHADDFFCGEGAFRDLRPEDLMLAFRRDALVGTLGLWDQHSFRQSVVNSYGAALRVLRPFYNLYAEAIHRPRLPAPGEAFHYLTAAIPMAADNDQEVFAGLLDTAQTIKTGGAAKYLLLGLHEADPLLAVVRRLRGITWYVTKLFHVCWEDGEDDRLKLDGRPPYLELGSL